MISTLPGLWYWNELVLVRGRPEQVLRRTISGYPVDIEFRPANTGLKIAYSDAMDVFRRPAEGRIVSVYSVPFTADLDNVRNMERLDGNERFEILRQGFAELAYELRERGFGSLAPRFSYLLYDNGETAHRGVGFMNNPFDIHPLLGTHLQQGYKIPTLISRD